MNAMSPRKLSGGRARVEFLEGGHDLRLGEDFSSREFSLGRSPELTVFNLSRLATSGQLPHNKPTRDCPLTWGSPKRILQAFFNVGDGQYPYRDESECH